MKTIWSAIYILFVALSTSVFADKQLLEDKRPLEEPVVVENKIRPLFEVKAGYFFFSDATMSKVYDQGGLDVQLSGSYPVWRWLQIYGSAEYQTRSGHSLGDHQRTRIWEVPLSLGLKPVFMICKTVHYYITIGPRYSFVHQHNSSDFVDKTVSNSGLGGFLNTGFNFFPIEHFLIDTFFEYSYVKIHFHPHKTNVFGKAAQVGGFTFGAGLGYAF